MAKKTNNYVDNARLGRLLEDYIRSNPNDNGEWMERYLSTVCNRNKNDPKRIAEAKEFVAFRKTMYEGQRPFEIYEKTCSELMPMLYKIIDGRLATYRIFGDEDLRQDCMLALLKYVNRYDFRKGTSALAYVTEVITQAANLHIKNEKDATWDGNLIPECQLIADNRSVDEFYGMDYND